MQWQRDQSPRSLQAVVKSLTPVVDKAVAAYAGPKASPTLRSRAKLLAADAVRRFDPKAGAELKSYVYGHLRQLSQLAPKINDPLPVPEQMRRDRASILRQAEELRNVLGRDPDDSELAEVVGLPLKRVQKVQSMVRRGIPLSALDSEDEDGDSGDGAGSVIGSARTEEDDWLDAVDHDLDPVDRQILRYRTGYQDHPVLSNQEIAAKLGVHPALVSRRAAKIQQRLEAFHG